MRICFLLFCLHCTLYASPTEEVSAKRIQAHLLVQDFPSASQEAREGLARFPQSQLLFETYIKALAKSGDEKLLWRTWNANIKSFPDVAQKREVLENVAWGIIDNASRSPSPVVRVMALLGAFYAQDAKGVEILCRNMRDDNSLIREAAVELSGKMRDAKLCDEVVRLFHQEKNWHVRLEATRSIGRMKITSAKQSLLKLISDEQSMAEEKAVAIEALVNMLEDANREEVEKLVHSKRSGLRLLACEVVNVLDLERDTDLMVGLLSDHNAEVRGAALRTLGLLRVKEHAGKPIAVYIAPLLIDPDLQTAILAAWALTLNDSQAGQQAFRPLLKHPQKEIALATAAALAATGRYGMPLMREAFVTSTDTYMRMNLALGLINQRSDCEEACEALYQGLKGKSERWEMVEKGGFKTLVPSKGRYAEDNPEATNQITRLEILNILAVMKYPHAQGAVRAFLKERNWGVTGMASALLLTEGDESALDIVEELLKDPDQKVRVQAALILSVWGRGEGAVEVLQQSYAKADRATKEKILEGLGRVGLPSTIPFLIEKMQEPYQLLRIIAAAALLECLYN